MRVFAFNLCLIAYLRRSGTHAEQDPRQYLLTIDQMVENGSLVPSYLADVFQKLEGWMKTPQVVAGA